MASAVMRNSDENLDPPLPGVPGFEDRVRREAVKVYRNCFLLALPPKEDYRIVDREKVLYL
jgi:hypothetical protein